MVFKRKVHDVWPGNQEATPSGEDIWKQSTTKQSGNQTRMTSWMTCSSDFTRRTTAQVSTRYLSASNPQQSYFYHLFSESETNLTQGACSRKLNHSFPCRVGLSEFLKLQISWVTGQVPSLWSFSQLYFSLAELRQRSKHLKWLGGGAEAAVELCWTWSGVSIWRKIDCSCTSR